MEYTKEQLDKIKDLVKTIEEMKLEDPYKTETYKMMLAQILGKQVTATQVIKETKEQAEEPRSDKEKEKKAGKTGRGNKSEIVMKMEELMEGDFFNSQKTMRNIQEKLREEGYKVDLSKMSPILLSLVKEKRLKRTTNEKKRFVYFKNNNNSGLKAETSETNLSSEDV